MNNNKSWMQTVIENCSNTNDNANIKKALGKQKKSKKYKKNNKCKNDEHNSEKHNDDDYISENYACNSNDEKDKKELILLNIEKYRKYNFAKHQKIKIKFDKQYEEYILCKYKNNRNVIDYINDNLIQKYKSVDLHKNDFYKIYYEYQILIMLFANVIENLKFQFNDKYNRYDNTLPECICNDKLCRDENCNKEHRIPFKISFASHKVSIYWSLKNDDSPRNIGRSSRETCYLDCDCGHIIETCPRFVRDELKCPYCTERNSKLCNDENCIACFHKSFDSNESSLWWSDKNEKTPRDYTLRSAVKCLFICICGHMFQSTIYNMSLVERKGCPYCIQKVLCEDINCELCREKSYESEKGSEYWSANNLLTPRQILKNSMIQYKYDCNECGQEFMAAPKSVIKNFWCSCICRNNKIIELPFEKSFASVQLVDIKWSPINNTLPINNFRCSDTEHYFECDYCKHTFKSGLNKITNNQGCPFCVSKQMCKLDNCTFCYKKSFASVKKSKYWSDLNEETPRDYFKSSGVKIYFKCKCKHTFKTQLCKITLDNRWCPYCAHQKLCDDKNCKMCFENSFANSIMAECWSVKNALSPRQILKSSMIKVIFDCNMCKEEYITTPNSVTSGAWCGCRRHKTEHKLYEYLKLKYRDITVEKQKMFDFCKNINKLPFDFCIEEYKLIIELDGLQHIKQVMSWTSPEETQKKDVYKMNCAKQNGYSIIRILQEDVLYNKNNWQSNLHDAIITIKNSTERKDIFIGDIYKTIEQYNAYLQ